jgi:OmpA-OmpF porin, OOP family
LLIFVITHSDKFNRNLKNMTKTAFLIFFMGLFQIAFTQKIITLNPEIDEQSHSYVSLTKVELTNDHTILHFRYSDRDKRGNSPAIDEIEKMMERFGMKRGGQRSSNTQFIQIDPKSRLYEPRNAKKKFRFVKAEGIPISPEKMTPKPGETLNFKVYYERLDPGIEVFDMFEGQDNGELQFWNYYGIHIRNPKKIQTVKPKTAEPKPNTKPIPTPTPPIVAEKPAPTLVVVKGNILDAKTQKPIAAKLNYVLPNEDGNIDSLQLSASTGKFKLNLQPGTAYGYVASAKGYFPSGGTFDLSKNTGSQEVTNDIFLNPVGVGESITLKNIYFEVSKFELLSSSFPELDRLVVFLTDNINTEIRIEGHTDNVGDFDENIQLSLNRANAVKKYLVTKGIASARIETKGMGPTQPMSKGTTDTERQKNRRVEFVIVKK